MQTGETQGSIMNFNKVIGDGTEAGKATQND